MGQLHVTATCGRHTCDVEVLSNILTRHPRIWEGGMPTCDRGRDRGRDRDRDRDRVTSAVLQATVTIREIARPFDN
jgi:hypothetical protein